MKSSSEQWLFDMFEIYIFEIALSFNTAEEGERTKKYDIEIYNHRRLNVDCEQKNRKFITKIRSFCNINDVINEGSYSIGLVTIMQAKNGEKIKKTEHIHIHTHPKNDMLYASHCAMKNKR